MPIGVARCFFDSMRSLAFGGISAVYAAVGSPSTELIRGFCINNNTQGDLIFSDDNTDANGKWFVPAYTSKLIDVQSNMNSSFDDSYVLPIGTQFYVKQVTAPVSGTVYIEIMY